jgi:hypothetical protein
MRMQGGGSRRSRGVVRAILFHMKSWWFEQDADSLRE